MNILLIGAPGSGKGTLSQKLTKKYKLKHLSTGDIFRAEIAEGTERGQILKQAMEQGLLAPSDILLEVMKDRLSKSEYADNVLLDGFGKTLEEAKELHSFYKIDKVIFLDVDYDTVLKRILKRRICPDCGFVTTVDQSGEVCEKCGSKLISRIDDNEQTFSKRYQVFMEQTMPIVKYFDEAKILTKINANDSIDKIYAKVCNIVEGNTKEIEK